MIKYGLDPQRKLAELNFSKTNENVAQNLQSPKIADSPSISIVASSSTEKALMPIEGGDIMSSSISPISGEMIEIDSSNNSGKIEVDDGIEPENELLDELKSFANNDALYHTLRKHDFSASKLRICSMKPHECVIHFLWGTVEIRINFYEVLSSAGVRRMEFNVVSLLKSGQPISEQVLRDIDSELSLYNGDHQPCNIDENDRSILQIGHKYILTKFNEKYRQLHKDYPDSSKLIELIHELSETANIARSMVSELLYIQKRFVVKLLPPDEERFRFSLTLLSIPLGSEYDLVFSFDPLNYPCEVIHPTVVAPDEYQHIYHLDKFKAAFLSQEPGKNYLKRLIKVAKLYVKMFVKAINYVREKNRLERVADCAAILSPPTPPTSNAAI